jgi:hypothetical protein
VVVAGRRAGIVTEVTLSRYAREEIRHEMEQEEHEMRHRERMRELHEAGLCGGPLDCGDCFEAQQQHHAGMCAGLEQCGFCRDLRDEREENAKHEGSYEDSFGRLVKE